MTRSALLLTAFLVAAGLGVPVVRADAAPAGPPPAGQDAGPRGPGGDPGPRGGGPMNPLANQLEQMNRVLGLTDEQKPKMKDELDALAKDLEQFRATSAEQMRNAMAALQADNADLQKARQDMQDLRKQLNDDYQKIISTHDAKINAILTDDQRVAWESMKLNRELQQRLGPVDLTDDQRQQIRQLVNDAGQDLATAKDAAAAASIKGKLVKKIVADILTEEQAGKLVTGGGPAMGFGGPPPGPRDGGAGPARPNRRNAGGNP